MTHLNWIYLLSVEISEGNMCCHLPIVKAICGFSTVEFKHYSETYKIEQWLFKCPFHHGMGRLRVVD